MRRRALLRLLGSTPLAGWLRLWPRIALGADETNAADVYQPAFAWAARLGAEDRARLRDAAALALDDPAVSLLIERARPALEAIRRAATIARCQWKREALTDDDLNRDQLSVFNLDAVRAVCLSARREAHRGRVREALDEVFAALSLAHRIGSGGVVLARAYECTAEVTAIQTLGRLLPDLDRKALDDLARRLDALPPPEPAAATIGPDSRFILSSLRTNLAGKGPFLTGDDWSDVGFEPGEAATLKRLTNGDRARILAHLETTGPAFAELARRLDVPRPRFRAALDDFVEQHRATQPVVVTLANNWAWGSRNVIDRMLAFRAMLRAGIALVGSGEAAFRAVADPYGKGPFGLDRLKRGFRIRSALSDTGSAPVQLTIGEG